IDGVTGPDEYSAVADNNVYTNLMAQHNFVCAADVAQRHPGRAAELGVTAEEITGWRDAAKAMVIPYDKTLGVHSQSEGFTSHQLWDFDSTTVEHYPLLLHFPYFDLYRKQVVKQADLVLAMHLRGEAFTAAEKARNFAYYEALTVRDSSLSACTQAVIAAETGHLDLAYDYLTEAARMDLDDLEHNTRDGLHLASLAGTWIALVPGLAGLRERNGSVAFAPRLPAGITRLTVTVCIQSSRLRVEITSTTTTYRVIDGGPLLLLHEEQPLTVSAGSPVSAPNLTPRTSPTPSQPRNRAPTSHLRAM
ncbi:MAG: family 65 glycosyl hydrolase, partial [Actinomycetota bacterium]|nr:family 65 glycosyl hydrolase [Actinomycetota bacterium]